MYFLADGEGVLFSTRCSITNAFQLCFRICLKKVQRNQVGLKLNRTHQLLSYADDVNLLGDNIDTIKKKHRNFN
jgi:hypothetical protein